MSRPPSGTPRTARRGDAGSADGSTRPARMHGHHERHLRASQPEPPCHRGPTRPSRALAPGGVRRRAGHARSSTSGSGRSSRVGTRKDLNEAFYGLVQVPTTSRALGVHPAYQPLVGQRPSSRPDAVSPVFAHFSVFFISVFGRCWSSRWPHREVRAQGGRQGVQLPARLRDRVDRPDGHAGRSRAGIFGVLFGLASSVGSF